MPIEVVVPPWGSQEVGTNVRWGPAYDARFAAACQQAAWELRDATTRIPLPPRALARQIAFGVMLPRDGGRLA